MSKKVRPNFFSHVYRLVEEDRKAQKLFKKLKERAHDREERAFYEELCIAKEVEETMLCERFAFLEDLFFRGQRQKTNDSISDRITFI